MAYTLLADAALLRKEISTMTSGQRSEAGTPNPNENVDPNTIDLGDDVRRTAGNEGSTLDHASNTGLEGGIDPGTTDLGDDVGRTAGNEGSTLDHASNTGLEGGIDPGATDLGDDVRRPA
jgi:hypothetical protein